MRLRESIEFSSIGMARCALGDEPDRVLLANSPISRDEAIALARQDYVEPTAFLTEAPSAVKAHMNRIGSVYREADGYMPIDFAAKPRADQKCNINVYATKPFADEVRAVCAELKWSISDFAVKAMQEAVKQYKKTKATAHD